MTAKANALSAISGINKRNVVNRATKSMKYFDDVLKKFKDKIIEIDYLVNAIIDVAVKLVREYNEPIYEGSTKIWIASQPQAIEYKRYSQPTTIDKNLVFMDLVGTKKPLDIKSRPGWGHKELGRYIFENVELNNDYLGNYLFGIVGKEMFVDINMNVGNATIGTDMYLINAAGLAQQWHNSGKIPGTFKWFWIRGSSGFTETGDNKEDVSMIQEGIKRWYRDYK